MYIGGEAYQNGNRDNLADQHISDDDNHNTKKLFFCIIFGEIMSWKLADEYYLSEQHISSFIGELN